VTDLHGSGFAIADLELSPDQCSYIATAVPSLADQRGGTRGLLAHPTIVQLIHHKQLAACLWSLTGRELVAVSARMLDSAVSDADSVRWHQERRVTVRERMDVPGYGPWTMRVGIWHVEPPASLLEQMLIVRLHLDEGAAGTHPLQVVPGSHRAGKLSVDDIPHVVETHEVVAPVMSRGTVVVMRPLLLHATPASERHYRMLQFELAPLEAISPLQWHSAVSLHRAA
jgi:hypothetical protein